MSPEASRWLLLIHQLPPKPPYFRVKIWRQLQALGAVPLKNSVYVLPDSGGTREDFQWVIRQIAAGGGEGSVVEARFVDGLSDGELRERFSAARDADYGRLREEVQAVLKGLPKNLSDAGRAEGKVQLARFQKRVSELQAIDFFGAEGGPGVQAQLARLEKRLLPERPGSPSTPAWDLRELRGRTWVTRKGLHVDRIACAWLIRRFIDPGARFRFVEPKSTQARKGELRFDMFEGEFTHEGDACSFETFLQRLGLEDPALHALGELVHDVDIKDGKFNRPECAGFGRAIQGVARMQARDEARIAAGSAILDAFYLAFQGGPH